MQWILVCTHWTLSQVEKERKKAFTLSTVLVIHHLSLQELCSKNSAHQLIPLSSGIPSTQWKYVHQHNPISLQCYTKQSLQKKAETHRSKKIEIPQRFGCPAMYLWQRHVRLIFCNNNLSIMFQSHMCWNQSSGYESKPFCKGVYSQKRNWTQGTINSLGVYRGSTVNSAEPTRNHGNCRRADIWTAGVKHNPTFHIGF